jgi:hypothetical protein
VVRVTAIGSMPRGYLPHVPADFDRTPRVPEVIHVGERTTDSRQGYTSCGRFVPIAAVVPDVDDTVNCSTCRATGKVEPW